MKVTQREAKRRACKVAAEVLEMAVKEGLKVHLGTTLEAACRIEIGVGAIIAELRRRGGRAEREDPTFPLPTKA